MTASEYELSRARTIAANEAKLRELGLLEEKLIPRRSKLVRKPKADPDYSPAKERRTTRVTGKRERRGQGANSSADEDEDSSEEEEHAPSTRTRRSRPTSRIAAPQKESAVLVAMPPAAAEGSCIVIEPAKTGRSKCRKCMQQLAQGELRVGMESWIMGRQALVWQHVSCFWGSLEITVETTSRGKCKQSKVGFAAGERRLSAHAHTTTANFKLSAAAELLRPIVSAAPEHCVPDQIADLDSLEPAERSAFLSALAEPVRAAEEETVDEAPNKSAYTHSERKQPAEGSVSRAKGKVCWLFAGAQCFGTLLPTSETATHCYARTHKGKTKTLVKGTSSWWMLDSM